MSGYCPDCGNTLCICKDFIASNSANPKPDDNAGARELTVSFMGSTFIGAGVIYNSTNINIESVLMIEKSAYEKLRLERDEARALVREDVELCLLIAKERDQLRDWQTKAKYEMEQMNNGRPSEWAYSVLRKERDDLELALKRADREAASECAELRNECAETHARIHIAQEEHTALRAKLERAESELKSARTIKRAVNDKARAHDDGAMAYHVLNEQLTTERDRSRKLAEEMRFAMKYYESCGDEAEPEFQLYKSFEKALAAYDKETGG